MQVDNFSVTLIANMGKALQKSAFWRILWTLTWKTGHIKLGIFQRNKQSLFIFAATLAYPKNEEDYPRRSETQPTGR
jgi:hypothetical protein